MSLCAPYNKRIIILLTPPTAIAGRSIDATFTLLFPATLTPHSTTLVQFKTYPAINHNGGKEPMRISELISIKISDCNPQSDFVYLRILGKGKKIRRIILSKAIYKEIQNVFGGTVYLFESPQGGKYYREPIARQIKKIGTLIGKKVYPHLFRHCFATEMILAGKSIKAVSSYLGHSSPTITLNTYTHDQLRPEELFPQASMLSNKLQERSVENKGKGSGVSVA